MKILALNKIRYNIILKIWVASHNGLFPIKAALFSIMQESIQYKVEKFYAIKRTNNHLNYNRFNCKLVKSAFNNLPNVVIEPLYPYLLSAERINGNASV